MLGKSYEIFIFFCLPDCWLVVSMHPEGPSTGHLDTGFLDFPVFKKMLRWFPSSKLLLHASHSKLRRPPNRLSFQTIYPKINIPISVSVILSLHFHTTIRTCGRNQGTFKQNCRLLPPLPKCSVSYFSPWFSLCTYPSAILPKSLSLSLSLSLSRRHETRGHCRLTALWHCPPTTEFLWVVPPPSRKKEINRYRHVRRQRIVQGQTETITSDEINCSLLMTSLPTTRDVLPNC
jgi:hypothetical protein